MMYDEGTTRLLVECSDDYTHNVYLVATALGDGLVARSLN